MTLTGPRAWHLGGPLKTAIPFRHAWLPSRSCSCPSPTHLLCGLGEPLGLAQSLEAFLTRGLHVWLRGENTIPAEERPECANIG